VIEVVHLDHMGDDLDVVNAARVSFDKESTWEYEWEVPFGDPTHGPFLSGKDVGLIKYLATHGHKSPFNHCFAKFRVKAPIFVARQLQKHEYMPWNEVSRRYVDSEPEFYYPDGWRKRAENVKQGSGESFKSEYHDGYLDRVYEHCLRAYNDMLKDGIAPEQARMVLPQSMMTEWIWSGSLYAFAKMCKLRLDEHSQYETRLVAKDISYIMSQYFPVSWEALLAAGRFD
jgi:thymidylate synthase (FAD)